MPSSPTVTANATPLARKESSLWQTFIELLDVFLLPQLFSCIEWIFITQQNPISDIRSNLGYYIPLYCVPDEKIANTLKRLAVNRGHSHYITEVGEAYWPVSSPITRQLLGVAACRTIRVTLIATGKDGTGRY